MSDERDDGPGSQTPPTVEAVLREAARLAESMEGRDKESLLEEFRDVLSMGEAT